MIHPSPSRKDDMRYPHFTKFYVEPGTSQEEVNRQAAERIEVEVDDPSLRVYRKESEDLKRDDGSTVECWTAGQRWDLMREEETCGTSK